MKKTFKTDSRITGDVNKLTNRITPRNVRKAFPETRPVENRNNVKLQKSEITAPKIRPRNNINSPSLVSMMSKGKGFIERTRDFFFGEEKGQSTSDLNRIEEDARKQRIFSEMTKQTNGVSAAESYLKQFNSSDGVTTPQDAIDRVPMGIVNKYKNSANDEEKQTAIEDLIEHRLKDRRYEATLRGGARQIASIVPAAIGLTEMIASGIGRKEDAKGLGDLRRMTSRGINKELIGGESLEEKKYAGYGKAAATIFEWVTAAKAIGALKPVTKKLAIKGSASGSARSYDLQKLGLAEDATKSQIKKKYREIAKEIHPDKVATASKPAAEKQFSDISTSYARLTGKAKNTDDFYKTMSKDIDLATADIKQFKTLKDSAEIAVIESYLNMKEEFMKEDPLFEEFLSNTIKDTMTAVAFVKIMQGGYSEFKKASPEVKAQFTKAQKSWKDFSSKYEVKYDPNSLGTFGGNMKFTKTGASVSGAAISPMTQQMSKAPTRNIDDIQYEERIFDNLSAQFKDIGKTKSPAILSRDFQRMLSEKKVTDIDDFLEKAERQIQTKIQDDVKIQEDIAKKDAESFIIVDPEVKDHLDAMATKPRELATSMGLSPKNNNQAIEMIEDADYSTVPSFDEMMGYDPDAIGGTVDIEDAWEYLKGKLRENYKPSVPASKVSKLTQKFKKNLTKGQGNLVDFKNLEKAKSEVVPKTPQKTMTERQFVRTKINEFNKGFRKGVSATRKDLIIIKKEIAKYARENIPNFEARKSEFTKITTQVAKAQNPKDLEKSMETIDEIVDKVIRRKIASDFTKVIKSAKTKKENGRTKGKLTAETQKLIQEIKKTKDVSLIEANEMTQSNTEKILSGELSLDEELALKLENEALFFAGIKEMIIPQAIGRIEKIKAIVGGARRDRKIKAESDKRKISVVAEELLVPSITGSNTGRVQKNKEDAETNIVLNKLNDGYSAMLDSAISLTDKLSKYDKTSDIDESALSRVTGDMAREADIVKKQITQLYRDKLSEAVLEVFAPVLEKAKGFNTKTRNRELKKQMEKFQKQEVFAKGLDANGKEVEVIGNQLDFFEFSMQYMNENTKLNIDNGEILIQSNKRRYELTEDLAQQIVEKVDPRLKKFGEEIKKEIFEPIGKEQAPLQEESTGVPALRIKDYWPRSSEQNAVSAYESGVSEMMKSSAGIPSSSKMRSANVNTVIVGNPFEKILKHIEQGAQYVSHYDFARIHSKLLANKDFTHSIRDTHGADILRLYTQQVKDIIAGKPPADSNEGARTMTGYIDNIMNKGIVSQLGGKFALLIKQQTSIPALWINPVKALQDTIDFFVNPKKNYRELMDQSKWLQNRHKGGGFEQDIDNMKAEDMLHSLLQESTLSEKSMIFIKWGDEAAIVTGGWHIYKEALRNGATKAEAIKKFEKIASATQQESGIYARNNLQKIKLYRAFRTYLTTTFQYAQAAGKNLRASIYGRNTYEISPAQKAAENKYIENLTSKKEYTEDEYISREKFDAPKQKSKGERANLAAKYLARFFLFHSALNMMFQFVGDGFTFKGKKQLRAAVLGNINAVPLIGKFSTILWGKLFLGENFDATDPLQSAVGQSSEFVEGAYKMISKKMKGQEITEKQIRRQIKLAASTVGFFTGLPVSGVHITAEGAYDLATDVTDNPLRLIMTKWAVGEGDSKKKPSRVDRIKRIKKLRSLK